MLGLRRMSSGGRIQVWTGPGDVSTLLQRLERVAAKKIASFSSSGGGLRRRIRLLLLVLGAAFLGCVALPSPVAAGTEEEAARQLELAEADLDADNFERAAASAASALRLDPGLYGALVVRALALKGLGRLEDAAGLLRAYRDLRGSLALDARVEPALTEIERARATPDAPEPVPGEETVTEVPTGPLAVFYGPGSDPSASERAYTSARPFLGGQPAAGILTLDSVVPPGVKVITVGSESLSCAGVLLDGTLDGQLEAAQTAAYDLDPDAAAKAAQAAELHLACGDGPVERASLTKLLSARAVGHWFAGEPEVAARLWHEMYTVDPEQPADGTLPPSAQAFQLDAKVRAAEEPLLATVQTALPDGWTAWIDGASVATDEVRVAAGRRILRLVGPEDAVAGTVLAIGANATLVVGTPAGLQEDVFAAEPNPQALEWLGGLLEPQVRQQGAAAALVVNLDTDPPTVRRFDGVRSLILTPGKSRPAPGARASVKTANGPHPGSVALLGGGLAATVVGVIVAAVANRDGVATQSGVDTLSSYSSSYGAYEAARSRERIGAGLAVGGGVVAVAGAVTFVIPTKTKPKVASR